MTFHSILFKRTEDIIKTEIFRAPDFFVDLNLNQIVDSITTGKDEYNLKLFFYTPLNEIDSIIYRHEIMQDLENSILFENLKLFAENMRSMRRQFTATKKLYYKYHKERWFLEVINIYCDAVERLNRDLFIVDIKSEGLLAFREYLMNYVLSDPFTSIASETKKIITDLSSIQYCVNFRNLRVQVRNFKSESNFTEEIEETFVEFKHDAVKDYRSSYLSNPMDMNHVEAQILNGVAQLYPEIFAHLDAFITENQDYLDDTIARFDREIQFYITYLDYIATLRKEGLKFCYPQITKSSKEVYDYEGFDLALAYKLIKEKSSVIVNDFYIKDMERIIVVSGPNQGGKTTFARTFGQLHHLLKIGCPVPGSKAQLFLCDRLFTHFEKEESIKNLRGKLQDDLVRIHNIMEKATSNSIIVMNEIFTSTTLQDQIFLSKNIMGKIIELDSLGIWVTFIDELASYNKKTVSMISSIVPDNPAMRTYKIIRGPADGLAYAMSIAEKYQLTYDSLNLRVKL